MAKWFTYTLLGGFFLTVPTFTPATRLDGIKPVVLSLSDSTPVPGETVTVTVTLNQASPDNETLSISGLNLGYFSSLPTSVAVNTGDTQETFTATVGDSGLGLAILSVSSATGKASAMLYVSLPLGV